MNNLTIRHLRPMLRLRPRSTRSGRHRVLPGGALPAGRPTSAQSIAVLLSRSAPCALKLAAQQKLPTKRRTSCAAATNTSDNLNNTAAARYADNESAWRYERSRQPTSWNAGEVKPT